MRRLVVLMALAAAACGGTRPCKKGTALLSLSYGSGAAAADALHVSVAVADQPAKTFDVARKPGTTTDTLEIDFAAGYPSGTSLTVSVTATQAGTPVAANMTTASLTASCTALSLALGGVGDGGTVKHAGEACAAGDVCETGFCVDGYCCNDACDGQCEACDVDGAQGTCTPVSGAPHGTRTACASDGTACGGACDGTNTDACAYPTSMCRAASCTGGVATAAASCDSGACPAPMTTTCAGGICGATECATVTQLALGYDFSCALMSDGTVRCWGGNDGGQLGQGGTDSDPRYKPTPVPGLTGVTQIAASDNANGPGHVCALLADKTLKCWGWNGNGQLGIGSKDSTVHGTPMPVLTAFGGPALGDVREVAAGGPHTCAIVSGGLLTTVKCWGYNGYGELGDGTSSTSNPANDRFFPSQVCGTGSVTAGNCAALQNATHLALADLHTCAAFNGSAMACWGENASGKLGFTADGNDHPNPVFNNAVKATAIAAGGQSSGAVLMNTTADTWGYNTQGQLGQGSTSANPTPTNICNSTGCGTPLSNVAKLVMGQSHACALTGGAVRCWGSNSDGQLGDNSTNPENIPATVAIASDAVDVAAGGYHTCAILSDGTVRCWGLDNLGQLGDNDMTGTAKKAPVAPVW